MSWEGMNMASRTSFFRKTLMKSASAKAKAPLSSRRQLIPRFLSLRALKKSIERYAPLWVLYSMTRDISDIQALEDRIFGDSGGKRYALKEIPL